MSSEQPPSSIVTIPSTQAPAPAQPSKVAILCEKRWHVFAYVFGFVAAFIALATVATVQINQYGSGATKGTILDSAWKTNKVIWPESQGGIPYPDDYVPGAKETNTSLALQLDLTFGNLIPASSGGTIDCRIHLELSNAYLNLATLPARPLYTLEMQLDGQKFTVSPTAQTVDWKVTMVLDSGNLLSFPFDKYSKSVTAIISLINSDGTVSLPNFYYKVDKTDAGFFSTAQGGSIDFTAYSLYTDPDDGSVTINFPSMKMTWQRPPFFRLYPMCLYIIFWIIMACEILYLIPFLIGSAKASFGNPGFYTSLLFAVPSMRNAMPGAPPIGSLADYYSFFWVMWVTVLMLLVSMHHFYMDNRKEQRPSGIPGETVLVGTWIAKNKKDPLPYRDNGMLDIPALIKFWKSTNAAEELF